MIWLARLTTPEAAGLARDPKAVVFLPLGAIEQHGPHLPLLVDWRRLAAGARSVNPVRRQHARHRLAGHGVALGADAPAIRSGELSCGPGSPPGDGGRAARAHPAPARADSCRGIRAGCPPADADGQPSGPGAHAQPEPHGRVALRRARDGLHALGGQEARAGKARGSTSAARWRVGRATSVVSVPAAPATSAGPRWRARRPGATRWR